MAVEMKRPDRRRGNPKQKAIGQSPQGVDVAAVANQVRYVGSIAHKDAASFAGAVPHPAPARSVCPRELNGRQTDIQQWLKDAILAGQFGRFWLAGFPKYVWHREGTTVFEGQLMRPYERGGYKGYPLEPDQKVQGL